MMRKVVILSLLIFASCTKDKTTINKVAELSCGQCQFGLDSQAGCDLAIRIDEKAYFIEGFGIDDFGDAHNKTSGFCEVVRKGEVIGSIENNTFLASSIKMVD